MILGAGTGWPQRRTVNSEACPRIVALLNSIDCAQHSSGVAKRFDIAASFLLGELSSGFALPLLATLVVNETESICQVFTAANKSIVVLNQGWRARFFW
jgi:hypothetical protein